MKNYTLGIVLHPNKQYILLLHRFKHPYQDLLNGIGGKVENNETAIEAMIRELKEETNITLSEQDKCIPLMTTYYPNDIILHIFSIILAEYSCNINDIVETDEGFLQWCSINDYDLLNIQNSMLAGDGNLPYFIHLTLHQ